MRLPVGELEVETGDKLLIMLGGINCGSDLRAHIEVLLAVGARYELLDHTEVTTRLPQLRLPRNHAGPHRGVSARAPITEPRLGASPATSSS
jgi:hypothetical protein